MLSRRIEREMEYSAKKRRFHSTPSIFAGIPHSSPLWYNLHSYLIVYHWEKVKGLIFHSQVSVFGDSCQRGRKYEPKAKGPHHHHLQFLKMKFFKLISYCVQKGEKVVSSKIAKPS
jgi:hypothetical protein